MSAAVPSAQVRACGICGGDAFVLDGRLFQKIPTAPNASFCRCSRCGLATYQPQAEPDGVAGYYSEDYYRTGYAAVEAWRMQEVRATLRRLRAHFPPCARILDFGAGPGHYARELRAAGFDVAVVESSPHARRILGAQSFAVGADWREVAGRFDLILMMDVLGHCLEPAADLEHAAALLRVGGQLVIRAPYFQGSWRRWEARLTFWKGSAPLGFPTILWRFEPDDVRSVLSARGFEVVDSWFEIQPWSSQRVERPRVTPHVRGLGPTHRSW